MRCPVDNEELKRLTAEDIHIDYCPKCKGVWLPRIELDKILERSNSIEELAKAKPEKPEYPELEKDEYFQKTGYMQSPGAFLGSLFNVDRF